MTEKSKAKFKLVVWFSSVLISFIPMIIVSFLRCIKFHSIFSDVFYAEFCKSSVLYISIASVIPLILNCVFNMISDKKDSDEGNKVLKWLNLFWLAFSILFVFIVCILFGCFSIEDIANQYVNNNQIDSNVLFVTNLSVIIIFVVSGLFKHIVDILKEKN